MFLVGVIAKTRREMLNVECRTKLKEKYFQKYESERSY